MTRSRPWITTHLVTAIGTAAVTLALFGGVTVATAASHGTIKACANKKTGELRLAKSCHHNEKRVTWAAQGPRGAKGAPGATGPISTLSPSKLTQRGTFNMDGTDATGDDVGTAISFPLTLSADPAVELVAPGTAPDTHCPGTVAAPAAAPGYLCIYIEYQGGEATNDIPLGLMYVQVPNTGQSGAGTTGALLSIAVKSGGNEATSQGTWAVTSA